MYIRGKGEVFLLDRDNSVFACSLLSFPARAQGAHISDTLLDGVMREREPSDCVPFTLSLCRNWLRISYLMVCGLAIWLMT